MTRFTFTPDADEDMEEIAAYLQALPRIPALRIGEEIQKAIRTVVCFPGLEKLDERLTRQSNIRVLRFITGQHVLFYFVAGKSIRILGVLHGKRDIHGIMGERLE